MSEIGMKGGKKREHVSFVIAGDTHGTLDIGKVISFYEGARMSIPKTIISSCAAM